ncbi:MAG: sortase [Anaerolineae bacterium]|nr:sortase [Anaerolineae bacterium]
MIGNLLKSISSSDWLALGIGLMLGIGVILVIRAWQAWRYRKAYGYDIYTADSRRKKLLRWATLAPISLIVIAGIYVWQLSRPPISAQVDLTSTIEEIDPLADMSLVIPRIGIDVKVIEAPIVGQQWNIDHLTNEVAHLEGTALPGKPGNAALAGHVTIPGAGWGPFKDLETLQIEDRIFITVGEETFVYAIAEITTVDADAVEVVLPTDDTRLTLLTCTGWDGDLEHYTQRIVVVAYLTL